jgi:hypothetical protein
MQTDIKLHMLIYASLKKVTIFSFIFKTQIMINIIFYFDIGMVTIYIVHVFNSNSS